MKLLSIILQNSKGDPMLLVCSNQFSITTSLDYSYLIYEFILTSYKNNIKLQRSFPITNDQYCISNVTKDFILSIIVSKNDLMLGFDGLRKLSEFFNRNIKIDSVMKRLVELFGVFQEFLYCRELPITQNWLPLRPQKTSRKRMVDFEILNRFGHIHYQQEKRKIVQVQIRQAKLEQINYGVRQQIVKNSRNFCIKVFEEENLILDSVKEKYIVNYKNRLFSNGFIKRKPEPLQVSNYEEESFPVSLIQRRKQSANLKESVKDNKINTSPKQSNIPYRKADSTQSTQYLLNRTQLQSERTKSTKLETEQSDMFLPEELQQDLIEVFEQVPDPTPEKKQTPIQIVVSPPPIPKIQKLQIPHAQISFMDVFHIPCSPRNDFAVTFNTPSAKVRMSEKLQLVLIDEKVKNVNQYGHVALEVNTQQKIYINLVSSNWLNKKYVITRITPNSFKVKQLQQLTYEVQADELGTSKGVIDYIISKETFNYNKIPLMFVSNFETRKNNKQNIIEYTFKYKVNDKWKGALHDIDIQIVLDPYIIFSDCKTNPLANSLKGKVVNWKAKELTENAKGKLALALYDSTMEPKDIIKQIRLSMRAEKSLLAELDVEFSSLGASIKNRAKKNLIIEYKILPK